MKKADNAGGGDSQSQPAVGEGRTDHVFSAGSQGKMPDVATVFRFLSGADKFCISDPVRADGCGADAASEELDAQSAGIAVEKRFCGGVDIEIWEWLKSGGRADLQDSAAAVHKWKGYLSDHYGGAAIEVDHVAAVDGGDIPMAADLSEAGGVDQDTDGRGL